MRFLLATLIISCAYALSADSSLCEEYKLLIFRACNGVDAWSTSCGTAATSTLQIAKRRIVENDFMLRFDGVREPVMVRWMFVVGVMADFAMGSIFYMFRSLFSGRHDALAAAAMHVWFSPGTRL